MWRPIYSSCSCTMCGCEPITTEAPASINECASCFTREGGSIYSSPQCVYTTTTRPADFSFAICSMTGLSSPALLEAVGFPTGVQSLQLTNENGTLLISKRATRSSSSKSGSPKERTLAADNHCL